MAEFLEKERAKGDIAISIQNPEETNRILQENGITSLASKSYQELAMILGTDAVISSRVSLAKPMSNAGALLTAIMVGPGYGVGSRTSTVDMSITDKQTGKMFWNYNWQTDGIFQSANSLTTALMKQSANNFPYQVKK